ncbi:RILP-like protein 1 isoform X2 [Echeneis naucrates]|uniref:RILP-like protein 1 isoform X2 n=1 Tax=Echeneis naucrates TaxID=173247 RepID=UPI001113C75B|nr:RILP-like protein 1 isoform X2 [Echeneis naucrates]
MVDVGGANEAEDGHGPAVLSALDRPAAELTVTDVYDIAAALGREFERLVDSFGCESLLGLVPKVVRVLELLEALVSRGAAGQEAEELRRELERLRQERRDRHEQDRRHRKELELVEDVWRGEVQDLHTQITQLQTENKRLLVSLSLSKDSPVTEDDLQRQEGMSEKERQVMKKLEDLVDKQRDEIRAKDHELTLKNEDVEAMQQHRLIRINQDLRHRIGVMEVQGKALIQQRVELEAVVQARQQEVGALQQDVARLKRELREWELEREMTEIANSSPRSGMLLHATPYMTSSESAPSKASKTNSVWMECGGDSAFPMNCYDYDKSPCLLQKSPHRENYEVEQKEDEDSPALLLEAESYVEEGTDSLEQESDKPSFTLQELRDVLQQRNELKAQVFVLQEELAYYKSNECEDDLSAVVGRTSPPPCSNPSDQPESGIRRLIFTAIMPMVAAGLIADDPTLLPIRRLVSFV